MDPRLLEAFFRRKWQILLPGLLIPLLVIPVAAFGNPPPFESHASVWVDRPTYFQYADGPDAVTTPAGEHGGLLAELMRTHSFRADVAKRTSLAPLTEGIQGERELEQFFRKSIFVGPGGDHLLTIRARAGTPEQAHEVVQAMIDAYRERAAAERQLQAHLAIEFYEQRLLNGRDFMLADEIRAALESARYDFAVAQQSQDLAFRVVDPPAVPIRRAGLLTKGLVAVMVLALVTGGTLSALTLLGFARLDRSVHSSADLPAGIPVLGVVPAIHQALELQAGRLAPALSDVQLTR